MPLYGQNVRGLTTLKLAKVIQFMKDRRILVAALQETWRVTKDGAEMEETPDRYLIIHHGEAKRSCKRGRNGVAIILSPEARMAWELGGKKMDFNGNGRLLTVRLALEGGQDVCNLLRLRAVQRPELGGAAGFLRRPGCADARRERAGNSRHLHRC